VPTIGTITKPGGGWHAYGGSSETTQEAEILVMPKRGRILSVGAWIGGWADTPRVRLCVWAYPAKTLLAQSAQIIVPNEGAGGPSGSNVTLQVAPLEVPPEIAKGASFYVGFARHPDDAHQVSTGASGSGPHYHGRSGGVWPNNLGNVEGPTEQVRRIGAYVADYETLPGAWVYRGAAWVEADTVQLWRGGVWVDADGVAIDRAGAWVDAE
jgi:hypothetical protein